jgi:hypothetical protein
MAFGHDRSVLGLICRASRFSNSRHRQGLASVIEIFLSSPTLQEQGRFFMKRIVILGLLFAFSAPVFAKTHKDTYKVPCNTLWSAVRDTLRNSGKYGIIGIDSTEMTASFNIGGVLTGKRINSVLLNNKAEGCELQVQTAFSGLVNNDYGDFKKRVDESLVKVQANPSAIPAKPGEPAKEPDATGTPTTPAAKN